jgi:uncharacterized coiled-coil DUF342 family protein
LQEEKELVERVKNAEVQLAKHRKIENRYQQIRELKTELNTLKTQEKQCHEELTKSARKSQQTHEKMLRKIDEAKKLSSEADSVHNLFLQKREEAKPLREEISKILNEIRQLRNQVKEEEKLEKEKNEETLREKLEKQAKEKLERGEKLTWEEFQLLAEKGMATQD